MQIAKSFMLASLFAVAAYGASSDRSDDIPATGTAANLEDEQSVASAPLSPPSQRRPSVQPCGVRVAICHDVSLARHPPCDAVDNCAMIEEEIARSCAQFDGDGTRIVGGGTEGATAVVRRYYAAGNAWDFDTAWRQWGSDGRPGQAFAAFAAGFAQIRTTKVVIGALQPGDSGAGSNSQPVAVTVESTLNDRSRQRSRGTYVVRRIDDVDGATADQLRWHLHSSQRKPVSMA